MATSKLGGGQSLRSVTLGEAVERYGPTLALIAALVVLVALLPEKHAPDSVGSGAVPTIGVVGDVGVGGETSVGISVGISGGATSATMAPGTEGAPTAGSSAGQPSAGQPAAAAPTGETTADGRAAIVTSGAGCRADGRQDGISVWQPPCIAWEKGTDNGGATARGVTRDKVLIDVLFAAPAASDAMLSATGATVDEASAKEFMELWLPYFNNHTQTFGREVVLNWVEGSGTDEQAQRADIQRMAEEDKAFGFINNCCFPAQLLEAGARKLVGVVSPLQPMQSAMNEGKGFFVSRHPTTDWVFADAASYIGRRLAHRKAKWAGSAAYQAQERRFGLIFTDTPRWPMGTLLPSFKQQLATYGVTLAATAGLSDDVSSWQNQSDNAMAKMKDADVTTVVYFGPILSQAFTTKAADRQAYFPEWYVAGICCNDSVLINRAASSTQWQHAFGTTNQFMWWKDDATTFEGVREAKHGNRNVTPPNPDKIGVATTTYWPMMQQVFAAIALAGPTLTPETYRDGIVRYGQTGGFIEGYPFAKRFFTATSPFMIQDQMEWWWDATATCKDEANRDGAGCPRWVNGGNRTTFQGWPETEPDLFNAASSILTPNSPVVHPHERDGHVHDAPCMSCGS